MSLKLVGVVLLFLSLRWFFIVSVTVMEVVMVMVVVVVVLGIEQVCMKKTQILCETQHIFYIVLGINESIECVVVPFGNSTIFTITVTTTIDRVEDVIIYLNILHLPKPIRSQNSDRL